MPAAAARLAEFMTVGFFACIGYSLAGASGMLVAVIVLWLLFVVAEAIVSLKS